MKVRSSQVPALLEWSWSNFGILGVWETNPSGTKMAPNGNKCAWNVILKKYFKYTLNMYSLHWLIEIAKSEEIYAGEKVFLPHEDECWKS